MQFQKFEVGQLYKPDVTKYSEGTLFKQIK